MKNDVSNCVGISKEVSREPTGSGFSSLEGEFVSTLISHSIAAHYSWHTKTLDDLLMFFKGLVLNGQDCLFGPTAAT